MKKCVSFIIVTMLFLLATSVMAEEVALEITDCKDKTTQIKPEKDVGIVFTWGEGSITVPWTDIEKVIFPCPKPDVSESVAKMAEFFSRNQIEIKYKNGSVKKMNYKWFAGSRTYNLSGKTEMGLFNIHATSIKQLAVK